MVDLKSVNFINSFLDSIFMSDYDLEKRSNILNVCRYLCQKNGK